FRGEIEQVPPMYSALKKDGVPLYKLARKGEEIERKPRKVVISTLDVLDFNPPEATLVVRCSKGTYIRVLGEDIGEALGCGAHLKSLRRTAVGDLRNSESVTLADFEAMSEEERLKVLLPPDRLLSTLVRIDLDEAQTERFSHGGKVFVDESGPEEKVRVYGIRPDGERFLMGVGRLESNQELIPERLCAFAAE
ncbi:tRNA pseudouridine(55) synthase TruB, partial [uncultured Parasutterella sp.]|uniref:tRNA pseudouridine synthase B n=1 Tax=uncultured Parasutterella sp. TaxID=1263098 RepID=UPI00272C2E2D